MIGPDGTVFEGRSLKYEAAHVSNAAVGNKNPGNVGIAFLGNYANSPLSDAQVAAAYALIKQLNAVYDISSRNVTGQDYIRTHAQFDPTRHSELAGAEAQIEMLKRRIYGR